MRPAALAAVSAALAFPAAAEAAERMFSYEPASADAKRLTGRGLTFIFDHSLLRTRAKRVMATAVSAQAWLKPVGEGALGKGGRDALAGEPVQGELYEVDGERAQGRVFLRAWCPGSTRLWLAVPKLAYGQPLPVTVIGDDPQAKDRPRICARMDFAWKGEWKLPGRGPPDPLDDPLAGAGLEGAGF